jgi:hypothetical protein
VTPLNLRKLANAFMPAATPSELLPASALSAVARFKRKHGGFWAGGTVVVTDNGVSLLTAILAGVFGEQRSHAQA